MSSFLCYRRLECGFLVWIPQRIPWFTCASCRYSDAVYGRRFYPAASSKIPHKTAYHCRIQRKVRRWISQVRLVETTVRGSNPLNMQQWWTVVMALPKMSQGLLLHQQNMFQNVLKIATFRHTCWRKQIVLAFCGESRKYIWRKIIHIFNFKIRKNWVTIACTICALGPKHAWRWLQGGL